MIKAWILKPLSAVLLLAALLRVVGLSALPPSLYWEEVALGYDAYSISKTGKDIHGNTLPLVAFPSFGDYKPSLYFYSIVPFISVFGLSAEAVRLPSALAGVGVVALVYLIGKRWSEKVGLWAAVFCAVQPWSVQVSRTGFETNLATFLLLLGIWLGLTAQHIPRRAFFAVLALCGSMYTYHSARIVAPLLGAMLGAFWLRAWGVRSRVVIRRYVLLFLSAVLLTAPILGALSSPEVRKRAEETGLFAGTVLAEKSNEQIEQAGGGVWAKLVHHRFLVGAGMLAEQYLANVDLSFLFLSGDGNLRHTTGMFGALYFWEIVTITAGVLSFSIKRKHDFLFVIGWMLIAAIPAALTSVSPHALRFLSAAPAFSLLGGIGVVWLAEQVHRPRLVYGFVAIAVAVSAFAFARYGWVHHRVVAAQEYQFGYRELYVFLEQERRINERVLVSRYQGRPSMYYLFFTKADPKTVQAEAFAAPKDQLELLTVGAYDFGESTEDPTVTLFATAADRVPPASRVMKHIYRPDGSIVWTVWRKE